MKKSDVVASIFKHRSLSFAPREKGLAFAPTNIALCKYWGKRDNELNLPKTASLSIALPDKGAMTSLTVHDESRDCIKLNNIIISHDTPFAHRLTQFLDLFRVEKKWFVDVEIAMSIPVAAGLASSACGFASIALALNDLFAWNLTKQELSILARLGSGSAARSLWNGFVEWYAGIQVDGMDSYATPLPFEWRALYVGILPISANEKIISSREAMRQTVNTSMLYRNWPNKVGHDLDLIKKALAAKNFSLLGGTSESNALAMHATMLSSWPPICYSLPETIAAMHKIWELRRAGLELYFTQDAGPNLKLLFLEKDTQAVLASFPEVEIVRLFE